MSPLLCGTASSDHPVASSREKELHPRYSTLGLTEKGIVERVPESSLRKVAPAAPARAAAAAPPAPPGPPGPSEEQLQQLMDMGFPEENLSVLDEVISYLVLHKYTVTDHEIPLPAAAGTHTHCTAKVTRKIQ